MLQQSFGLPQPLLETLTLSSRRPDASRHVELDRAEFFEKQLLEKLDQCKVPVRTQWGVGSAKTVSDLTQELIKGECSLLMAGNTLFREFRVARIDLYYYDDHGNLLRLKEDRQEFKDGRIRNRGFEFAVGEKAMPLERPWEAAHRGLKEELNINGRFDLVPLKSFVELEAAKDFPGIPSISRRADYRLVLPQDFYKSQGYVDVQDDKRTFFIWVPAPFKTLPEPLANQLISF